MKFRIGLRRRGGGSPTPREVGAAGESRGGGGDDGRVEFLYSGEFLYRGQAHSEIPRDVIRVRVAPSARKVGEWAFWDCQQLEEVELGEGLEEISECAFGGCKSLKRVKIPPSVKKIGKGAFWNCERLEEADIREGLQDIGENAFSGCKSLKRLRFPPTVRKMGERAFAFCERLDEVELREGLDYIGKRAFLKCMSLRRVALPSTLNLLGEGAFQFCYKMERADIREGLEQIGESAFAHCGSLPRIRIPATVRTIGKGAFSQCVRLVSVELDDGLDEIRELAFENCFSLRNISVPSTVRNVSRDAWQGCHDLRTLFRLQDDNVVLFFRRLEELPVHQLCYDQSHQPTHLILERLVNVLDATSCRIEAPITAESSIAPKEGNENERKAAAQDEGSPEDEGRRRGAAGGDFPVEIPNKNVSDQDCLGMTPLHILALSTKQDLDLYRLVIAHRPEWMVTKDKWGCTPIFYAIWGGLHPEIIRFLIDGLKSTFPDADLDWDMMISSLCRARAPLNAVKELFEIKQVSFSERSIDWQGAARELTINCLVGCDPFAGDFPSSWESMMEELSDSRAYQNLIQGLLDTQQSIFPDPRGTNWQGVCEEFVRPLEGWWRPESTFASSSIFRFLVRCSIPERLSTIGVKKWRTDIEDLLSTSSFEHGDVTSGLASYFDSLNSKLVFYELEYCWLRDAAFLLELALWKAKIGNLTTMERGGSDPSEGTGVPAADVKTKCRIHCGAEIIIPNVMQYLIVDTEKDNTSVTDINCDENGSIQEDIYEGASDDSWSQGVLSGGGGDGHWSSSDDAGDDSRLAI